MKKATVPKKIPIRRQVITFLSNVASGSDSPTTAIIKAKVTPRGIPPFTNPMNSGMDEQEQNGVMAPNRAASRYCNPYI